MRFRFFPTRRLAGAVLIASALALVPAGRAGAAVFYDVTMGMGLGDDQRVFLNVTNDHFAPSPEVAVSLVKRCPVPVDDFPVILLLARGGRRSPEDILRLRLEYLSWSDIMFRMNISPAVLFTGINRDPGPPYGKAWGYWKKHPRERLTIRDRDVVGLAKLQVASARQRVSPYTLIAERNKGVSYEHYVAEKNRGKYPKSKPARKGGPKSSPSGHGKPKAQEHGKPNHHGKP